MMNSQNVEIIQKRDDNILVHIQIQDKEAWDKEYQQDTPLNISGMTTTDGINMIEAVERKDLSFCLGVQFHPEVAVRKTLSRARKAIAQKVLSNQKK